VCGGGLDLEEIHQPLGADDTQPHSRSGTILPSENLPHVLDPWPLIGDARQKLRRIGFLIDEKRDPASFCVGVGIAGDL
jgi:hypothetical protein